MLSCAYAASLHARAPWLFVTLPLPLSRLVGAQLGELNSTDHRVVTHCVTSCSARKKLYGGVARFLETGWASAYYWEVVSDYLCITCLFFPYFISLINFILTHIFFLAFGLPILPHHIMGSEQAATWKLVCEPESVYHVYTCVCVHKKLAGHLNFRRVVSPFLWTFGCSTSSARFSSNLTHAGAIQFLESISDA